MDDNFIVLIALIIVFGMFLQSPYASCQGYKFQIPRYPEQYQANTIQQPPIKQGPQYIIPDNVMSQHMFPEHAMKSELWQSTGYMN